MSENTDPQPDQSTDEQSKGAKAGREMLAQLQQMIDTVTTQAGPVMRDVAAKAAELAAVAGEKAGPLAYKAAGATESIGQRVAAKSKDFAADLRRWPETATDAADEAVDHAADSVGDAADQATDAVADAADAVAGAADQATDAAESAAGAAGQAADDIAKAISDERTW